MKPRSKERGQALILIALGVVGLFGFSALAIDGSRVFSDRRHAQNAADTAALAAALAKVRQNDWHQAAIDRAKSNGYITDAADNDLVEAKLCSDATVNPACEGIPSTEDKADYIQVKIVSTIPTTFARIVGRATVTSAVTAVAHAGSGIPKPFLPGAALVSLKPDGDGTFGGNGNLSLDVLHAGTFNNSINNCGMNLVGTGEYHVDTSFQVANGHTQYCESGHPLMDGPIADASQIPYPPNNIYFQPPTINCSGNPGAPVHDAAAHTYTFSPGNYPSGINLVTTEDVHFSPGNYCFGSGVKLSGTTNIIANGVNFSITSGDFSVNGSSNLTCNDALFYIHGGGTGVHINGNSNVYCNSVTFYAETGDVTWNGTADNRLFAPKGGDYENLLIYMPYGNNSTLTINGNSGNELTGSIIAVSSPVKISGNSGTSGLHSQIIGYTVDLQGNSNTTINYDPSEQVVFPNPSEVGLTK